MINAIKAAAEQFLPDIVQLRRTIHRNPELAYQEHETARLVRETLRPLGLSVQSGIAGTGVVATLQGEHPGPTVMLRADMDALPIQEESGVAYASERPGIMHACGHDVHTSSLLGTAMILHHLRARLAGTIRMIFQPSEELAPGGAKPMIDAGILRNHGKPTAAAFAQHVMPSLPAGTIGIRSGQFMASSDTAHTTEVDLWFASEDFAYFLQEVPGALYLIGAGSPHALHTSRFVADEACLPVASGFMAYLAWLTLAGQDR